MNGRPKRRNKAAFSHFSGVAWTLPYFPLYREQNFCYSMMARTTCRYGSSARRIISSWLQKMKAKPEVSSAAEFRKKIKK